MNRKRIAAFMTAATMLLNVTPVMAAETASQGATTVTGSGTVSAYDKTPQFKVTLPTSIALDFTVDPYGLLDLLDGESVSVDELTNSGAIMSASGSAAIIKNESSVPVTVSVTLTATQTNNNTVIDFKNVGSDVATGSGTNMFLAIIPSADQADSADNYVAASYAIPATTSPSGADAKFKLNNAEYEVVNNSGSFAMQIVSGAANYDSTVFKVGGLANPEADWSDFMSGGGSDVSLSAVFSYEQSDDAEEVDDSFGVYGLVSGSATNITDDMGSVGGAYTKTYTGDPVTFTGIKNCNNMRVIYLNGKDVDLALAKDNFEFSASEGYITFKTSCLENLKNQGNKVFKAKLFFPESENREPVIITINF
ncbi:MAG: hypothetical protein NC180_06665 [Muribaculaceae bacterium]|nr:hypothetical protein [Roseburia sp.]MCM1429835.1 hypothetical protein [Muribaculaceae bacterium]MCM1492886.1 hypothetical protein [Muribaculaceae bacterium]